MTTSGFLKLAIYLAIIIAIGPIVGFRYLQDIPYIFIISLIFLSSNRFKYTLLLLGMIGIISSFLYSNFGGSFYVSKFFLADLRPIILYIFLIVYFNRLSNNKKIANLNIFYSILFFASAFSLVGYFSSSAYIELSEFYNPRFNDIEQRLNVASVAASGNRFSSFFSQPVTAGSFFLISLLTLLSLSNFRSFKSPFKWMLLSLVLIGGLLTKSTFFNLGIVILTLFYPIYLLGLRSFYFYVLFSPILILVFFLTEIDIFSGRYSESSNFLYVLSDINLFQFLLPYPPLSIIFPRAFGDSSVVMKVLSGGLLYVFYYYSVLLFLHFKFMSILKENNFKIFWFNVVFLICLLGELGFTAFSQPRLNFLILFCALIYFNHYKSYV